jgi:hypothetical protein
MPLFDAVIYYLFEMIIDSFFLVISRFYNIHAKLRDSNAQNSYFFSKTVLTHYLIISTEVLYFFEEDKDFFHYWYLLATIARIGFVK